jgi:hypothetical protein
MYKSNEIWCSSKRFYVSEEKLENLRLKGQKYIDEHITGVIVNSVTISRNGGACLFLETTISMFAYKVYLEKQVAKSKLIKADELIERFLLLEEAKEYITKEE